MPMQRLFLLFSFALVGLSGCSSSPTNDDAPASEQAESQRIANHTKGWVTADTLPSVVLTDAPSTPGVAGEEVPESAFSISPATAGTATWQNETTIVWQPEAPLTSDTTYTCLLYTSPSPRD